MSEEQKEYFRNMLYHCRNISLKGWDIKKISVASEKTFPLHKIIQYRNIHKLKILLPIKNVNEKNEKGYPVLVLACEQERNDEMLELLLSHDKLDPTLTNEEKFNALHSRVTDKGDTPLMLAAKMDHFEVITYLHGKGANINHLNKKCFTALSYAANNGYIESTKELLKLGAKTNFRDDYGCTPLQKAASWGFEETCRILLEYGADVNAVDSSGQTSLTKAIRRGSLNVSKQLLENGANPSHVVTKGTKRTTPLIFACLSQNTDCLSLLIEHGAKVNFPGPHSLALFTCIKNGFCEGVSILLDAGADIEARNTNGKNALQSAIGHRKENIVKILKKRMDEINKLKAK
ncbi:hypothetical protein JTB14_011835 [Gonioctena quinquepunctata]|nr:hypothetical protein JTB14_011835 [Gonioctena quinquepunctata]